jgi:hypothetical protein
VQLRLALPPAERDFGRAVTVTVSVGAGLGFLVTLTFTVLVAVAVIVTVLPACGAAPELDAAPRIAAMTRMTTLRMQTPMTIACFDAGQSPLAPGCDGWPGICHVPDTFSST